MIAAILQRLGLVAFGLALALGLLVGTELTLRALHVGEDAAPPDPFAGFSEEVPAFERAVRQDGVAVYRTAAARGGRERAEFLAEKPRNGFRVFVVGGSSAAGTPYGYDYAFGAWLERRLRVALPDRTIEVVNAAHDGYASRRVLGVVRDVARHEPDLLIVYAGHNELAERRFYRRLTEMDPRWLRLWTRLAATRLYGVLADLPPLRWAAARARARWEAPDDHRNALDYFAEVKERVEGRLGDAGEPARQELHYRRNVEAMIQAMREAGAQVLLATLSQNFADWPPGASSHRADLDPEARAAWEASVGEGDRSRKDGHCERALAAYREALSLDATYARLHYEIARCERALGHPDAAYRHFRLASDLDRVPSGAYTDLNRVLRELALENGALLVDVESLFEEASPGRLVGDNLFVDLVHPNLRGHQLVARAIAETLRSAGLPEPAARWRDAHDRDPDPEALYAAKPELRRRERLIRAAACELTRRRACALEIAEGLLARDANDEAALRIRERALALEPAPGADAR